MTKRMEEYKYSSYNEFLKNREIITEEGIRILFGSIKGYKEQFINIHRNGNSEEFIDIREKTLEDFIKDVEERYNNKFQEVIKNKEIMKRIVIEARNETSAGIRELAKIFNVSKSTIGNYINNKIGQ